MLEKATTTASGSPTNCTEPKSTQEVTQHVVCILDANFKKADLQAMVDTCTHLSSKEQSMLLELLTEYELPFDGTLGAWKTMSVSFEL